LCRRRLCSQVGDEPVITLESGLEIEEPSQFRRQQPLRKLNVVVDAILDTVSPQFETLYAKRGRPSIPPERLLDCTARERGWRSNWGI
jgi:hypothetical protein